MAIDDDNVVGVVAIKGNNQSNELYINQIAVKNEYKRQGIATELLKKTKELSDNRDIVCHIKDFNTPSKEFFKSIGFICEDKYSENGQYRCKSLERQMTKMQTKKPIKRETIAATMEDIGYYSTEDLQYDAGLALLNFGSGKLPGQDVYAMCLEGPTGAGKSEYAKTYIELANRLLGYDVKLVKYQCDATTGKNELIEDIDIVATVGRDLQKIRIPGKVIEAIKLVNEGKKVILFVDELEKSREETDTFFYNFLQSGELNAVQHRDLEIKEEYKGNLQVIFCKNDARELTVPLSRRIRIIRLDYMKPEIFYNVAQRVLVDDRKGTSGEVQQSLIDLVALIYNQAYEKKELFSRLPSCSEMLIAVQAADDLIKYLNAPDHIVYNKIIVELFKNPDDIMTFEQKIVHRDQKLKDLVTSMKATLNNTDEPETDITSKIAKHVFKDETAKMEAEIDKAKKFVADWEAKFRELERNRTSTIKNDQNKIPVGDQYFGSDDLVPNAMSNFLDETAYIKRAKNIFSISEENWTEVGTIIAPKLWSDKFAANVVENAAAYEIAAYENGFLLHNSTDYKLIMVRDFNETGNSRVRFFSSTLLLPPSAITAMWDIKNTILKFSKLPTAGQMVDEVTNLGPKELFQIDCLVYGKEYSDLKEVEKNIYKVDLSVDNLSNEFNKTVSDINKQIKDDDISNVEAINKTLLNKGYGKQKKLGVQSGS